MPISQAIRDVKTSLVHHGLSHSYTDVLNYYILSDASIREDLLDDAQKNTSGRSVSPYYYLDYSVYATYNKFNGDLFLNTCFYTLWPFFKYDKKWSNIAATRLEGGGDISESIPLLFYMDIGMSGSILTVLFYTMVFIVLFILTKAIKNCSPNIPVEWLFIYYSLHFIIKVERVPEMRILWNTWIPMYILYTVVIYITTKANIYITTKANKRIKSLVCKRPKLGYGQICRMNQNVSTIFRKNLKPSTRRLLRPWLPNMRLR